VKKIALFADVQNLYYTVRQAHGCHFNYAALWAEVSAAICAVPIPRTAVVDSAATSAVSSAATCAVVSAAT